MVKKDGITFLDMFNKPIQNCDDGKLHNCGMIYTLGPVLRQHYLDDDINALVEVGFNTVILVTAWNFDNRVTKDLKGATSKKGDKHIKKIRQCLVSSYLYAKSAPEKYKPVPDFCARNILSGMISAVEKLSEDDKYKDFIPSILELSHKPAWKHGIDQFQNYLENDCKNCEIVPIEAEKIKLPFGTDVKAEPIVYATNDDKKWEFRPRLEDCKELNKIPDSIIYEEMDDHKTITEELIEVEIDDFEANAPNDFKILKLKNEDASDIYKKYLLKYRDGSIKETNSTIKPLGNLHKISVFVKFIIYCEDESPKNKSTLIIKDTSTNTLRRETILHLFDKADEETEKKDDKKEEVDKKKEEAGKKKGVDGYYLKCFKENIKDKLVEAGILVEKMEYNEWHAILKQKKSDEYTIVKDNWEPIENIKITKKNMEEIRNELYSKSGHRRHVFDPHHFLDHHSFYPHLPDFASFDLDPFYESDESDCGNLGHDE